MKKFLQDFKAFAMKGNVVDMAVGVIIGGAFGKIVSSVVNDVIMPPIGVLIGGVDFKDLKLVLKDAVPEQLDEAGNVVQAAVAEVTLNYGSFIQNVVDFLIIALTIFFMIKGVTKLTELRKKKEVEAPAAPAVAPVSADGTQVKAPMPGTILAVKKNVGEAVKAGDVIVVLEAMKMENDIVAPCDGTVKSINAPKGTTVNTDDVLAVI